MYKKIKKYNDNFKKSVILIALFCVGLFEVHGQIPEPMKPARMVNDFANVLSSRQRASLERQLVEFNDSTSTQIVIVTTEELAGMSASEYATELGHKWGVGQKNKDNGIVILYKPKTEDSRGEVFIAVGYGLEGVVPDGVAKIIIENAMIPYFRDGETAKGLSSGVSSLFDLVSGEYTAEAYTNSVKGGSNLNGLIGIFIVIMFIASLLPRKRRVETFDHNGKHETSSMIPWVLLSMMSSSSGRSSGGGFSSGGGSSFGGFGGGGFGGGGAGGSW